jgi:hypothetical protein
MNALSIPTWVVHLSSVLEWAIAIVLMRRLAELSGQRGWNWMAWAMLPAFVSALCACTWHYFDNPGELNWLVTLQAGTTLLGNTTLMLAAWRLWQDTREARL